MIKTKDKIIFEREDFPPLLTMLDFKFKDLPKQEREVAVKSALSILPSIYTDAGISEKAFKIDKNRKFPVPSRRFFLLCYVLEIDPMAVIGFRTSLPTLSEKMGELMQA